MRDLLALAVIALAACAREAPRSSASPADRYAGSWEGSSVREGSDRAVSWKLGTTASAGTLSGTLTFTGPDSLALAVRIIELSDSGLVFEIGPYRDSEANAEVITRFDGRVSGSTLAGTFVMLPTKGGGVVPDMSVAQWHNAVLRPIPGSEPIPGMFVAVRRASAP